MELRTTREMRQNEQLTKTMAKMAEGKSLPAKAQAQTARQSSTDKVSLSRQALAFLEEQDRKRWEKVQEELQRKLNQSNELIQGMENAKNQGDAMARALKVLLKCQKIAASIMKGNRVPPEDEQYLMENDPDGYKLAMALRKQNPDPEDEESVLDDEDQNGSADGASGGGETPSVESSAPSEGGGDAAPAEA